MNSLRYVGASLREFGSRWVSYLLLVGLVAGSIDLVVVPLLSWLTELILAAGHLAYLSYDNAGFAITHRPWTVVALVAMGILVLALVYLQFAVLLGGVENIRTRKRSSFRKVLKDSFSISRLFKLHSFGFFALYFLLIVPFAGLIVGSRLLAKVTVPDFILDFLIEQPPLAALVAIFYASMAYLGVRWIRVLPNVILRDMPFTRAARESWRETKHHFWMYVWRMVLLFALTTVVLYVWMWGLIGMQMWFDEHTAVAFPAAIVTMALLIGGKLFMSGASAILYLLFLTAPYDVREGRGDQIAAAQMNSAAAARISSAAWSNRHSMTFKWLVGIAASLAVAFVCVFDGVYMGGEFDYNPLTISHRGVDDGNGVQNTLPALEATAKEHPDYVEMDIHETKDEQFVVMHDENLLELTGVNAAPHDLTLSQLQALTAHENGKSAPVVSFDKYLAAAKQLHQKLVVEIKTTPRDSAHMLDHFVERYSAQLIQRKDRVQSLDYHVVAQLRRRVPNLFVSFIMPYSLVFPNTDANAYTAEVTTLNDGFVDRAQARGQQVWAWTVNDEDVMETVMFLGVDGVVTDNLATLKQTLEEQQNHPSYAQRLRMFATILDATNPSDIIEN